MGNACINILFHKIDALFRIFEEATPFPYCIRVHDFSILSRHLVIRHSIVDVFLIKLPVQLTLVFSCTKSSLIQSHRSAKQKIGDEIKNILEHYHQNNRGESFVYKSRIIYKILKNYVQTQYYFNLIYSADRKRPL